MNMTRIVDEELVAEEWRPQWQKNSWFMCKVSHCPAHLCNIGVNVAQSDDKINVPWHLHKHWKSISNKNNRYISKIYWLNIAYTVVLFYIQCVCSWAEESRWDSIWPRYAVCSGQECQQNNATDALKSLLENQREAWRHQQHSSPKYTVSNCRWFYTDMLIVV